MVVAAKRILSAACRINAREMNPIKMRNEPGVFSVHVHKMCKKNTQDQSKK